MKKIYAILSMLLFSATIYAQVNVTFSVDMSDVDEVSPLGVHVTGDFQDPVWNPSGTPLTDQGDGIWSITLPLSAGAYEFKFLNGNSFDDEEVVPDACRANLTGNTNRRVVVDGTSDVTYAVCFSSCAACGDYAVLFRVDMSLEEEVAPVGVHVAGSFQGAVWDPGAETMTSTDGTIFTRLVTFDPAVLDGTTLEFKYINGNSWLFPNENISNECGQGGNRVLQLSSANTVTPLLCYNQCGTCVAPVPVVFQVDMSNETVNAAGVFIAGELNPDNPWTPGVDELIDTDGDGIYEITMLVQPGTYQFKFVNGAGWPGADNDYQDESVPSGCAENNNRQVTITEEEGQLYQYCFGQCSEVCSANPDPAEITFNLNAADITVSESGLWLIGNFTNPAWQAGAIELTDDNGDGIYSATVLVSGAAEFQFKYTNGDPFPGGVIDALVEETYDFSVGLCGAPNGIGGFNRIHVRTGEPENLPVVCYNSCVDCGENVGDLRNPFAAMVFPNPANDRLNIVLGAYDGLAEVRIADLSGRIVAVTTLNFSAREVNLFDVSALSKGMYVVQVIANERRSTLTFLKN